MRLLYVGFVAAYAAALAGGALAAPVAMVTDLQGAATLAKDKSRLGLMAYVEPGTEVMLGANAKLTLTFLTRPLEQTFSGPAKIVVQTDRIEVLQGGAGQSRKLDPEKVTVAAKFEPAARDRMAQATFVMRSTSPRLELIGPAATKVSTTTPEFSWKALKDASGYKISLLDDAGKLLREHKVSVNTWTPHGSEALAPGKSYQWKVEATLASALTNTAQAQFSVLDKAAAKRIAKRKPAAHAPFSERLLYAALLENEGLKHDAAPLWRSLAAERPDEAALQKWVKK
jgi:hypothetical protein